ncbi:pre-mRNA-splicing factor syf2 [Maudiozyma exigua]|uniref:Pre-mRNA-splicing factor SYF2 n=1 Tax=Maudiozyma exigua TaxID=34358 RepID=A0A9P7B843_MAUEX|nr:pre-mRNA-splicing factor syf2 [Kazachstania exigua]
MDLIAIRQKFKELKRKCKDIEIEDRKLIETHKKPVVYSPKDLEDVDKTNDTLAKRTYDKEIKDIKRFRSRESEKGDKLDELVNHLNSNAKKRYNIQKKRIVHNELLAGGFINDKNKQFNSKITKERESNKDK